MAGKKKKLPERQSSRKDSGIDWIATTVITALSLAAGYWARTVTSIVPEPYLDEVFHIPQAQKYCDGRFAEWDDKITTPPGLYIFSLPYTKLLACGVLRLREFNSIALAVLGVFALVSRRRLGPLLTNPKSSKPFFGYDNYAIHTAVNIALCPVIFFFSGLYYTDVASTAVVLAAFMHSLDRMSVDTCSVWSDITSVLLGVLALFMRQTNVFWVVVCFGAFEAVHAVETLLPPRERKNSGSGFIESIRHNLHRYSVGDVHDPPLDSTWPSDMLLAATSLLIAAAFNPLRVARQIWPHMAVLGLFVAFVIWNGGVVLGDKSNHVATIHLAQMLYIWPLFAFFSLPLLLPYALQPVAAAYSAFRRQHNPSSSLPVSWIKTLSSTAFPVISVVLSLAIVKSNTIIHPFTLADNRHYMFYVFRYTIRRARWIPLALVLPYTICRWLVWSAISGSSKAIGWQKEEPDRLYGPYAPPKASTALVWLLATTLSLITAPLVEPRYFIIPWVVWRLMVPPWQVPASVIQSLDRSGSVRKALAIVEKYNLLLWIETVWFLAVNAATMYIFLMKPYQWKAEDGTLLDGGRWQRFMW